MSGRVGVIKHSHSHSHSLSLSLSLTHTHLKLHTHRVRQVLACDGAGSQARKWAEAHAEGFKSQVTEWGVAFRLLFSK